MFTKFPPNIQGILLAFLGFACFSIGDSSAKYMTQFYAPYHVVGMTAVFTLLVCSIFSQPLGGFQCSFQTKKLKTHLARGVCNSVISLLVVAGLAHLPLSTLYTLIFVTPFVTTIMSIPFFKERVDAHGWLAIFTGFCGVLVVMRPGVGEFNFWLLLPLIAAFFISFLFLLAKSLDNKETLLSLGLYPSLSNFILILPVTLFLYGVPEIEHLPYFALTGLCVIGGLTLTALAFRVGKASIVAPIQYSQILWGVLIGYFVFNDTPDLWTMVGAVIIIGSGIYLLETERRLKAPQAPLH